MTATHEDTLASRYIADKFRKAGARPFFSDGYYQGVTATRLEGDVYIRFNGLRVPVLNGWSIYPQAPVRIIDAPLAIYPFNSADSLSSFMEQPLLRGSLLVIPGSVMMPMLQSQTIDSVERILQDRGCLGLIWSGPQVAPVVKRASARKYLPRYRSDERDGLANTGSFPELAMTDSILNLVLSGTDLRIDPTGRWQAPPAGTTTGTRKGPAPFTVVYEQREVNVVAPNIVAMFPGSDTSLSPVIVGAHHDHDGHDGGLIYPGAVDNASGTAAVLELAELFRIANKRMLRPRRTVIFASFTGEERGLLGSYHFVDYPARNARNTFAMLNLDMLGRVDTTHERHQLDGNYVYTQVEDTLGRSLKAAVTEANEIGPKLVLDQHFQDPKFKQRMLQGSDHFPFFQQGIPIIGLNCGFTEEYHMPGDTADKMNWPLLRKQVQLAFLALMIVANTPDR